LTFQTALNTTASELYTPFPNPANPHTTLSFALKDPYHVKLDLYNILGQKVRTLLNEERKSGLWHIQWDGCNETGLPLASGVYMARLTIRAGDTMLHMTKKLLLER